MVRRLTRFEVGFGDRQRDLALERPQIAFQRVGDDHRLLENLFLHEMARNCPFRSAAADAPDSTIGALDRLVVAVVRSGSNRAARPPSRPRRDRRSAGSTAPARARPSRGNFRPRHNRPSAAPPCARRSPGRDGRGTGRRWRRRREAAAAPPRPRLRATAPRSISRATRCATTSLSVSLRNVRPSAISSSRSGLKFSMMPLCTSATGPAMCGWALPTVGAPCVAQRVWAMPMSPWSGCAFELARCRLSSLPSARRRSSWPSSMVQMPALS